MEWCVDVKPRTDTAICTLRQAIWERNGPTDGRTERPQKWSQSPGLAEPEGWALYLWTFSHVSQYLFQPSFSPLFGNQMHSYTGPKMASEVKAIYFLAVLPRICLSSRLAYLQELSLITCDIDQLTGSRSVILSSLSSTASNSFTLVTQSKSGHNLVVEIVGHPPRKSLCNLNFLQLTGLRRPWELRLLNHSPQVLRAAGRGNSTAFQWKPSLTNEPVCGVQGGQSPMITVATSFLSLTLCCHHVLCLPEHHRLLHLLPKGRAPSWWLFLHRGLFITATPRGSSSRARGLLNFPSTLHTSTPSAFSSLCLSLFPCPFLAPLSLALCLCKFCLYFMALPLSSKGLGKGA